MGRHRHKELNCSSHHDLDSIWRKVIWLGGEKLFQIVCFRGVGIWISLLLFVYSMFYGLHSISNCKLKDLTKRLSLHLFLNVFLFDSCFVAPTDKKYPSINAGICCWPQGNLCHFFTIYAVCIWITTVRLSLMTKGSYLLKYGSE